MKANTMSINLGNIINAGTAVREALEKAAADPKVSLEKGDAAKVAVAVTAAVNTQVAVAQKDVTAQLDHLQNTEAHWYQKRSRWAAIVAVAAPILTIAAGFFGFTLTAAQFAMLIDLLTTTGGAVSAVTLAGGALWSAYLAVRAGIATKPLGE